jgi:hypothetical protein
MNAASVTTIAISHGLAAGFQFGSLISDRPSA